MSESGRDTSAVAAYAAAARPGPEAVAALASLEPAQVSHESLVDLAVAIERQVAWLQGRQFEVLAELADRSPVDDDGVDREWVREEVAAALRLSGQAAGNRLAVAQELRRLPRTAALLAEGRVSARHAQLLAEAVLHLDDAAVAEVEARIADKAPSQSPAAFRRSVQRAVLAVDGRRADERNRAARTRRRVVVTPVADGMAELYALLPAEGAATVKAALDALARRVDTVSVDDPALPELPVTDARTADQRRADALVELAAGALTGAGPVALPALHGLRPAVQISVALSTLLGKDDEPGELAGYGPVPAELARRLADDPTGVWRRLVTDDVGRLLDYGRTTYRPPRALAQKVVARDQTCRFPNCHRRAELGDIDHHHDWDLGGATSEHNLGALCRRHHRAKHVRGWTVRRSNTGDTLWVSPLRRHHVQLAATYPVDRTVAPARHGPAPGGDDPPPF